ncbi:MAG: hypothetical protein HC877_10570 [Thioploca sp.]|nr:hypothetical protein [Thioploca sp.]
MNENHVNLPINLVHQEGAVLVVALVILVVLTMLGISGIEATKLETRMADNVKKYNTAFQDAEAQLAKVFNQCMGKVTVGEECSSKTIPGITDLGSECTSAGSSGGSLNRIFKLATVTGKSGSDPHAIEVNLVAGMWSPGAQDNMMAKTTNQKNCNQDEQICPLSELGSDSCEELTTDNISSKAEGCAEVIVDYANNKSVSTGINSETCKVLLIKQACKPEVEGCSTAINNHIAEVPPLPLECKEEKCTDTEIKTACEEANAGKPEEVRNELVNECVSGVNKSLDEQNKTEDNPTPDAGNNPTPDAGN